MCKKLILLIFGGQEPNITDHENYPLEGYEDSAYWNQDFEWVDGAAPEAQAGDFKRRHRPGGYDGSIIEQHADEGEEEERAYSQV